MLIASLIAAVALVLFAHLAPLEAIERRIESPGTAILAADGMLLHRDEAAGLRIPVELRDVAPIAIAATIAAEDQRFYAHPGIDAVAVVRALLHLAHQRSGASTITQQLARRLYLRDDNSPLLVRKFREASIALRLEARYSKRELLEAYLNDIYYGRGAYGIEAAARVYFGVPARDLTLAQASLLVGMPQLPGAYDPLDHEAAARARQRYVLDRLVTGGTIDRDAAERAAAARPALLPREPDPLAPHFVAYVFEELRDADPSLASRPGIVVRTTLDADLQREASASVRQRLATLADQGAGNAAVVVTEPGTGRLLAMVGGADFAAADGQVNMATALRQPGSTLKPFLYAAAFEAGYQPGSMLLDTPGSFDADGGPYVPVNYDQRFHGPVSLRTALASSLNLPAVRTLDDIGVDAMLEMLHRVGLRSLGDVDVYGLALTLGAGEVPLVDLVAAYGVLATGGLQVPVHAVESVHDADGSVLFRREASDPAQVLAPEHAFVLADILSDRLARMLTFGAGSPLETPFPAAVKTGTSSASRDNWTIGFTPDRVVGVWVGNADGRSMHGISGVDGAAPIWRDMLLAASARHPARGFEAPPGLQRMLVCAPTGLVADAGCPAPVEEWVLDQPPAGPRDYYGRDGRGLVVTRPPSAAQAWHLDAGIRLAGDGSAPDHAVHVLSPVPGSTIYAAHELPRQEVLLRASVPVDTTRVEFRIDGVLVAVVQGGDARAIWSLEPGEHELDVTAFAHGARTSARARFDVIAR